MTRLVTGQDGAPSPGWSRGIAQVLLHAGWRPRVHDRDLVPATGPVLLAANHIGFVDGPLVQAMSPRPVHFLVKADMFRGVLGTLLRAAGQIPVDRTGDRGALLAAARVLRAGGVVGVFPEGTRGRGDLSDMRGGAAWLALQTGAPVVPVAVLGTRRGNEPARGLTPLGRRLDVVFGVPLALEPAPGMPRREAVRAATDTLRAAMDDHVRQAVERTGQQLPEELGPTSDQIARGEHR